MTETYRSEIEIAAPQATVFAFLTDPDKILRWMGTKATVEPYPGGIYLLSMNDTQTARGQFTEVIPVHRLAYSLAGCPTSRNAPATRRVGITICAGWPSPQLGATRDRIDLSMREGPKTIASG
jgi:uncharacterized protein YndB with AHSA1/START domain